MALHDTGMNQGVAGVGPSYIRGGQRLDLVPSSSVTLIQKSGASSIDPPVAFDDYECFRKPLALQSAGVA